MSDDARAELVRAAFDAEAEEAPCWRQLGGANVEASGAEDTPRPRSDKCSRLLTWLGQRRDLLVCHVECGCVSGNFNF